MTTATNNTAILSLMDQLSACFASEDAGVTMRHIYPEKAMTCVEKLAKVSGIHLGTYPPQVRAMYNQMQVLTGQIDTFNDSRPVSELQLLKEELKVFMDIYSSVVEFLVRTSKRKTKPGSTSTVFTSRSWDVYLINMEDMEDALRDMF